MTKKEIIIEIFKNREPFYNEKDIMLAMDNYLVCKLKEIINDCKLIHSEYIIERIEQEIDYVKYGC